MYGSTLSGIKFRVASPVVFLSHVFAMAPGGRKEVPADDEIQQAFRACADLDTDTACALAPEIMDVLLPLANALSLTWPCLFAVGRFLLFSVMLPVRLCSQRRRSVVLAVLVMVGALSPLVSSLHA